jgi:PAS domain S-box-containing protein
MHLKRNRKANTPRCEESTYGRAGFTLEELGSWVKFLLDFTSDGIVLVDQNGVIVEWNSRVEKITGLPGEEAVGRFVWDIQSQFVSPDHKPELTSEFLMHAWEKEILGMDITKTVTGSGTIVNRNGEEVLVEEIVVPFVFKARILYCSFQNYTFKTHA